MSSLTYARHAVSRASHFVRVIGTTIVAQNGGKVVPQSAQTRAGREPTTGARDPQAGAQGSGDDPRGA